MSKGRIQYEEGTLRGDVRLWAKDLPMEFRDIMIGQKIKVTTGVYNGMTLRVVGKSIVDQVKYTYCVFAK